MKEAKGISENTVKELTTRRDHLRESLRKLESQAKQVELDIKATKSREEAISLVLLHHSCDTPPT